MGQPIVGSNPTLSATPRHGPHARTPRHILRGTNSPVSVDSAEPTSAPDVQAATEVLLEVVPLVMRTIRREMRSAVAPALTVPQLRTLLFVRRHPNANLSAVAEHLGVALTSASGLVDRLVRHGLLDRRTDPDERRRVMIALTDAGADHVERASRSARAALAERLQALAARDLAAVESAMSVLRKAFTPPNTGSAR